MLRLTFSSPVAIALALLLALPALAFNFPLSDEAIREAYLRQPDSADDADDWSNADEWKP